MEDYFVGTVGITCGLLIAGAALFHWTWWYQLPTVQRGIDRWGLAATRMVLLGVGTMLIMLGGVIALGWTRNVGRARMLPSRRNANLPPVELRSTEGHSEELRPGI